VRKRTTGKACALQADRKHEQRGLRAARKRSTPSTLQRVREEGVASCDAGKGREKAVRSPEGGRVELACGFQKTKEKGTSPPGEGRKRESSTWSQGRDDDRTKLVAPSLGRGKKGATLGSVGSEKKEKKTFKSCKEKGGGKEAPRNALYFEAFCRYLFLNGAKKGCSYGSKEKEKPLRNAQGPGSRAQKKPVFLAIRNEKEDLL